MVSFAGFGKALAGLGKKMKIMAQGAGPIKDAFKAAADKNASKTFKQMGKTLSKKKGLVSARKLFQSIRKIGRMALSPFNFVLSVLDAFGVAAPLLQTLNGVLGLIGASILEEMMPALNEFIEFMFSEEMMTVWDKLGTAIGEFLGWLLTEITKFLEDPVIQIALNNLIDIFMEVGKIIMAIVGSILRIIGGLSASELGAIIYAILIMIAFIYGMSAAGGGVWGLVFGLIMAGIAAAVLAPLLSMQKGGIVTRPTLALIGEAGPEAVIPLKGPHAGGMGRAQTINVNITGGVFATDEYDLAQKIARKIQLYNYR